MDDKQPREFKFRLDEEPPESILLKKPVKKGRSHDVRPSRAWPIISAVLLVLTIGALAVAYLDMNGRINRIDDTGAQKAQTISLDLQSKFSSLSLKFAHMEEALSALGKALDEKTAQITQKTEALETSSGTQRSDLNAIKSGLDKARSDRAGMEKKLSAYAKDLKAVAKNVTQVRGTVAPLEKAVTDNRAAFDKKLQQAVSAISALEKKIANLAGETKKLNASETENQAQHARLRETIKQHETRTAPLAAQLADLKKQVSALAAEQKKQVKSQVATPPTPAPPAKKERSAPKQGELIEQDIR